MENMGYKIGHVKIGTQTMQSEDGRERNVSTIEVQISRWYVSFMRSIKTPRTRTRTKNRISIPDAQFVVANTANGI